MSPEINTALMVLVVGMITVFIILGLVVMTGHFLIKTVNTFFPAKYVEIPKGTTTNSPSSISNKISNPAVAAIVSAVELVTSGKGKINKIEKLD